MDFDTLGIENIRAVVFGDLRTRVRSHAGMEWRTPGDSDNYRVLIGYPAVFNEIATLYESKHYVLQERIAPGAFDGVLADDCHLNYVHESASAMARNGISGIGGMELSVDKRGLRVYAALPLDDLDVQRLAPKMDRGVVDQMSFAFTVAEEHRSVSEDEQGREVSLYTITKIQRLYDVCVAPIGAYSQTEAALRSVFAVQISGRVVGREALDGRSSAIGDDEGCEDGAGRSEEGSRVLRKLLAECDAANLMFIPREERHHVRPN